MIVKIIREYDWLAKGTDATGSSRVGVQRGTMP